MAPRHRCCFFADKVDYTIVYITEAHPSDGWALKGWETFSDGTQIQHHRTLDDRLAVARKFRMEMALDVPILVDGINDELEQRYEARPERLYVVHRGKVLWRCGLGPWEYDVPGLETFLAQYVG